MRFAPRALGRLSATLEVTLARGGPLRVAVTGIGVQPGKPRVTRVVAGPAPRRRGARVAFALSRAAKVVVTLQRRVGSRLVRVAKAERARAFGPSAIVLGPRLGVGRYRVTVRARDARGRTSATVVRTFRLR